MYYAKVNKDGASSSNTLTLYLRFKAGNFIEKHGSTIGVDFSMKTVDVDGKRVKVS